MKKAELKKLIGAKKLAEVQAHVKALQARGKGPDEITSSLRRKFPEVTQALIQYGYISVTNPSMP